MENCYPEYAVKLPTRFLGRAGLAERYLTKSSPLVFSSPETHEVEWIEIQGKRVRVSAPHTGRRLTAFHPERLIPFLIKEPPTRVEEDMLCAGLRAWVICPTRVIKTKQNSFREFSSASFVEAQMMRELLAALSHTFDSARRQQLAASSAEMTARQFLSDSGFDRFDFDLLFLLGGFSGTLSQISPEEAEAARINQMAPVKATITMLHVLHKRLFEVRKNAKLKMWGINRASEEASKIHKEYRNERGQSAETFANYWENTRLSAPLLYAAALTDGSMMLEWLIGSSPYWFERMSTYMSSWFQTANRVAEELLKPLHLLHPSWRPLQVRGSLSVLPSPVPDEKLASLLNDVLTEEQLWNRPFTGRGQIILAPDGTETYHPLES